MIERTGAVFGFNDVLLYKIYVGEVLGLRFLVPHTNISPKVITLHDADDICLHCLRIFFAKCGNQVDGEMLGLIGILEGGNYEIQEKNNGEIVQYY